jgi:hypothetical protein
MMKVSEACSLAHLVAARVATLQLQGGKVSLSSRLGVVLLVWDGRFDLRGDPVDGDE